jgi:hypothetical protein
MDKLDKLAALEYIVRNNNLCQSCNRANINEIRIAAGLYLELVDIINSPEKSFSMDDLTGRIKKAGSF